MKNPGVVDRFIEIIDDFDGGVYSKFAKRIGTGPSTLRSILSGNNLPNTDTLLKINHATGISIDWLLLGIEPKNLHKRELHELPDHSLSIITTPEQKAHWEALEDPRNFSVTPIISDIAAGPAVIVDEKDIDGYAIIYQDWLYEGEHVCFRVKGRSMEPVLSEGDIVGVNTSRRDPTELHNGIIAGQIDGGITVKKFRLESDCAYLIPENIDEYSPQAVKIDILDQVIVGLVEWWWKRCIKAK